MFLLGDKQKRYLQRLEAIARAQSSVPTTQPPTLIEHSTELGCQGEKNASSYNDVTGQGSLEESLSHTYFQLDDQDGTEGNLLVDVPGYAPFQPTTGVSIDQHQGDVGLLGVNSIIPSAIDPSMLVYSDVGRNILGIEDSRFPNSQDAIQRDPLQNTTLVPPISNILADAQLSENIMNRKFTLEEILMAGIRTLSEDIRQPINSTSSRDPETETRRITAVRTVSDYSRLPDIRMNTIQLTTISFIKACMSNAAMLGLSPAELLSKKSQSPFYRAQISHEVAQTCSAMEFVHLKPQLRPSNIQVIHPHHPYLDILPFPVFRNCAIQLLQLQPPPFDPAELCRDLQSDGLICWGSSVRDGGDSTGTGAPWDIRSWEMQPWFHKKWWLLTDGADGEMCQQTQWWCQVRGGCP